MFDIYFDETEVNSRGAPLDRFNKYRNELHEMEEGKCTECDSPLCMNCGLCIHCITCECENSIE